MGWGVRGFGGGDSYGGVSQVKSPSPSTRAGCVCNYTLEYGWRNPRAFMRLSHSGHLSEPLLPSSVSFCLSLPRLSASCPHYLAPTAWALQQLRTRSYTLSEFPSQGTSNDSLFFLFFFILVHECVFFNACCLFYVY